MRGKPARLKRHPAVSAARVARPQVPAIGSAYFHQSNLQRLAVAPKAVGVPRSRILQVTKAVSAAAPPKQTASSNGTKEKIRVGVNGVPLPLPSRC